MMGFFFTHGGGDQQMELSPFACHGWTSNAVGSMREKHTRVEEAFASNSRMTINMDRAPAISRHYS
jgi:hypothetical protein